MVANATCRMAPATRPTMQGNTMKNNDLFETSGGDSFGQFPEKLARFNSTMDRIEKWLMAKGIKPLPGEIQLCDSSKTYAVRLNIGKRCGRYLKIAPAFWRFVSLQLPVAGVDDAERSGWNGTLKRVSLGWEVSLELQPDLGKGAIPSYEFWRVQHSTNAPGRVTRRHSAPRLVGANLDAFL
jgi:hypothetical protein